MKKTRTGYREYVENEKYFDTYEAYQQRYRNQPRESDRVLVRLAVEALAQAGEAPRALDVGCSTGNLLYWLQRALPKARLVGSELAESSLEQCRRDPELARISFETLDITAMPPGADFDAIIVNAVFYCLSEPEFEQSVKSVARALKPGGSLLAFDFFHEVDNYRLALVEHSRTFPDGHKIAMRPRNQVRTLLEKHGFAQVDFHPFSMPFDLERQDDAPILTSYTRRTEGGERLTFRGVLYQPWCHLVARLGSK